MNESKKTAAVTETLSRSDIHDNWEGAYRNEENEKFYDLAFDWIAGSIPRKGHMLDAGCGSGAHAIRLAERGFQVTAIDFSELVLENARTNIQKRSLSDAIEVRCEDLLSLSFGDAEFDHVLCWGVLMHIPEQETALDELSRVLKPRGQLVLSEVNVFSLEDISSRCIRTLLRKSNTKMEWTDAGLEMWGDSAAGKLLARRANIRWLQKQLCKRGFIVRSRIAGQFSESYSRIPTRTGKRFIHRLNRAWFRFVRFPQPAFGNLIIAEKRP